MAKWLSEHASTACFDKSPQSQSRGITLDLGFSSMILLHDRVRVTFVDCPGHAALFKNVIGAASVIDAVMLVVDGTRGVQTQTAECLVLASIVTKNLIVAVNKSDAVSDGEDWATIAINNVRL
jgi:selenocysteine-specific elongation factor